MEAASRARPALPQTSDFWQSLVGPLSERLQAAPALALNGQDTGEISELYALLTKLERKLEDFDAALGEEFGRCYYVGGFRVAT